MKAFVLDASATAAWCLTDEASPEADALLEAMDAGRRAVVPPIWAWEVANLLVISVRRGRLLEQRMDAAISILKALPIDLDQDWLDQVWTSTIEIARAHALSAYDASYLELAMRRGLPLATRDGALIRAAKANGVELILSG